MDYQHSGWFRPTCAGRCPQQTARQTTVSHDHNDAPEGYASLMPTSLSMVLSPCQEWRMLYEPCKALMRGTLFAELDKPFSGKCC